MFPRSFCNGSLARRGVSRDVYVSLMGSRGPFATVHSKRGRSMCWSSTVCLVLRAHWVSIFAPAARRDVAGCKALAAPWRAPKNYAVRASTVATLRRIFSGNPPAAPIAPDRLIDTARYRARRRRSLGLPLSCRHRRPCKLIGLPFRPNLGHRCCFPRRAAGLNQKATLYFLIRSKSFGAGSQQDTYLLAFSRPRNSTSASRTTLGEPQVTEVTVTPETAATVREPR